MSGLILQVDNIAKRFGGLDALAGVSLSVNAGERVALLGHNGAGKTTLFRLILGFTRPDSGSVLVVGDKPGSDAARRAVSYLPENVVFPKTLTGHEILSYYSRLKGAPVSGVVPLLEKVGLEEAADRAAGTYSKGMRQRLGLAQALAGTPQLLLLDEPTSGLDPLSRQDFYVLVDEVAANGSAVLLSSHSLSELEARTDRVAILRKGKLVADAPLDQLQTQSAVPLRIRVRARHDSVAEVNERLGGHRINGQSVELLCPVPDKMSRLAAISALGSLVTDIDVTQPSLDEVYRHFSIKADKEDQS